MKKCVCCLCLIVGLSGYSHAFVDAIVGSINDNANAVRQAAHEKFVELKWIQQIKTLRDNYVDSQKFYNRMKVITDHRGGVGGYFSDEMKARAERLQDDAYWDIRYWWESDPSDTTEIQKLIDDTDAGIKKQLDHSEKIREWGKKREKSRVALADEARGTLSPQQMDSLLLKIGLLQLEVLSSIDVNLQQSADNNLRSEAVSWQQEKKQLKDYLKYQRQLREQVKKDDRSHEQKVYEMLRKTPSEVYEPPVKTAR